MRLDSERKNEQQSRSPASRPHSQKERTHMGKIMDKAKGKMKGVAGALTGDNKLKAKGEIDQAKGNIKGAAKSIKQSIKRAAR
jgi:uncharacterized protein YjbJ (UPF0337 family)